MLGHHYTCRRIRRLLSDRVDGALPPGKDRRVKLHLASCPDCREEFAFYQDLKRLAAESPAVTPPACLWERINLRIDEHPWGSGDDPVACIDRQSSVRRPITRVINYAGAVLSFVLISMLCLHSGNSVGTLGTPYAAAAHADRYDASVFYASLYMMADPDRFPTEVRNHYLGYIEGLDRKIETIKSALDRYPENRQIKAQLALAYKEKIQVYQQMGLTSFGEQAVVIGGGGDYDYKRGGFCE
jgi:hypothetical protein